MHEKGGSFHGIPSIYAPEHIRAWKVVTDAVHAKGAYIACQLWHVSPRLPNMLDVDIDGGHSADVSLSPSKLEVVSH
jgi:2,4-dienoyl-CoA reductase-like NADH-dependent reductase (Old Yellow Enzyme family)